jgi:hypothetical protein
VYPISNAASAPLGAWVHDYTGIYAGNTLNTTQTYKLEINNNELSQCESGIEVWQGIKDFDVQNNVVNFATGYTGVYETGIKITNAGLGRILGNTISRNSTVLPPDETSPVGILCREAVNCEVNENNLVKMGTGIHGVGNCVATTFQCNSLVDNFHGFRFGNGSPATISDQVLSGGNPQSSGNDWGAGTIDITGWITGSVNNQSSVNWYYFNNALNIFNCNLILNYQPAQTPSNCNGVLRSPEIMRELLYGKTVRGQNVYAQHSAEYLYIDTMRTYSGLEQNRLLNLGDVDDTLYQAFYDFVKIGNVGKFGKVNTYIVDSLQNDTLQAKTINSNIAGNNSIDENQLLVNNLYLKKLLHDKDLEGNNDSLYYYSEDETSLLQQVAYQHPAKGGNAVYMARILLYMDVIDGEHHQRTMQTTADTSSKAAFELYPNPNTGSFTVKYRIDKTENASIVLADIQGKTHLKQSLTAENNSTLIEATQLKAGMYFYTIEVNSKTVQSGKVVIVK